MTDRLLSSHVRRFVATLALVTVCLTPTFARADEDVTPRVLAVSGAALAGLSMFFAFEAQLAGAHEAPPSEARAGVATVFTVVSISSLVLSLAAIGVSVVMTLSDSGPADVTRFDPDARPLVIDCPALSCLPEPAGVP